MADTGPNSDRVRDVDGGLAEGDRGESAPVTFQCAGRWSLSDRDTRSAPEIAMALWGSKDAALTSRGMAGTAAVAYLTCFTKTLEWFRVAYGRGPSGPEKYAYSKAYVSALQWSAELRGNLPTKPVFSDAGTRCVEEIERLERERKERLAKAYKDLEEARAEARRRREKERELRRLEREPVLKARAEARRMERAREREAGAEERRLERERKQKEQEDRRREKRKLRIQEARERSNRRIDTFRNSIAFQRETGSVYKRGFCCSCDTPMRVFDEEDSPKCEKCRKSLKVGNYFPEVPDSEVQYQGAEYHWRHGESDIADDEYYGEIAYGR